VHLGLIINAHVGQAILNPIKLNLHNYGKPFTHRRKFFTRLCKRAGVKYFDYHSIRHLTAIILYRASYPVGHIQPVLRYKNSTTTERYLKKFGLELVRDPMEFALRLPAKVISFKAAQKAKPQEMAVY
jgi:integrase